MRLGTTKHVYFEVVFCLLVCLFLDVDASQPTANVPGEVVMVNVLFRHGDRTPVDPYPLDPYRNLSYWPTGWGQLTTRGMHQHYELGKWLRKRYQTLFAKDYTKADVYIQSTDVDRTLMSAESNLAGMFPPVAQHKFLPDLNWQPIPIHTVPEKLDHILAMKKPCPRYDAEFSKLANLPEIKSVLIKYKNLFSYLSEHTGKNVNSIENAEFIHSALFIESLYNLTLPEWTHSVYPDPLASIAHLSFALPAYTKELQRLKGGPLVAEWLEHFRKKQAKILDPDRKMFIYSGHDTTVANILSTLGVFEPHCPPYAATVMLELHKKANQYYIALFYKNTTEATLLTIPGCSPLCEFDKFVMLVSHVIPQNWEKECHHAVIFSAEDLNDLSISALALAGVLTVVLFGVSVHTFLRQRRQHSDPFRYQTVSTHPDA